MRIFAYFLSQIFVLKILIRGAIIKAGFYPTQNTTISQGMNDENIAYH